MARKLFINGATGSMWISDGTLTNSQAETNSLTNRSKIYFHSNLPYIQIKQTITASSLVFAAQARGVSTWDDGSKGCGGGC